MKSQKEINIKINASWDSIDKEDFKKSIDEKKEIEARRKIFSGRDFKL